MERLARSGLGLGVHAICEVPDLDAQLVWVTLVAMSLEGSWGSTAVLAAVSFIAYLLGSMLLLDIGLESSTDVDDSMARSALTRLAGRLKRFVTVRLQILARYRDRSMSFQLDTFVETRLREAAQNLDLSDHLEVLQERRDTEEGRRRILDTRLRHRYARAIIRDLPAVGIQLQAKNRDFWDTYDRQTAEAQFRFGIAPPLALIIVLWARQSGSFWWVFLLVVPFYLLLLGMRQSALATSTLIQAVVLRMVEPPVFERLREQVAKQQELHQQRQKAVEKRQREEEEARQNVLLATEAGRGVLDAERRLQDAEYQLALEEQRQREKL